MFDKLQIVIFLQHGHFKISDVLDKLPKYEFLRLDGLKRVLQLGQTYILSLILRFVHKAIMISSTKTPIAPYKKVICNLRIISFAPFQVHYITYNKVHVKGKI